MDSVLYLDYCATTPLDPAVLEEMSMALKEIFGNANSPHVYGWQSHNLLKKARIDVAALIGATPHNIIFNSGATEGNNSVFNSVIRNNKPIQDCHIITSEIEHKCILAQCHFLKKEGADVSYLPTDPSGKINIDALENLITDKTRLISIMAANNETGVLQDIKRACAIAKAHNVLLHVDGTQWIGKIPFNIFEYPIDFLTFSSHKIYGPKGVGVLYAKDLSLLRQTPLLHGGEQEFSTRAGTINLPSILGLAVAARVANDNIEEEQKKFLKMKKNFINTFREKIPNIVLNGAIEDTLPSVINFYVKGAPSRDILSIVQGELALSTGSACTSKDQANSHVLLAMGLTPDLCQSSIRLSFGRFTKEEELEKAASVLVNAYQRLVG